MKTVSLFDWNGELYQQVQDDEVEFNIKLTKIEGSECMGFTAFQIEGEEAAINTFLGYYELELNPEGSFADENCDWAWKGVDKQASDAPKEDIIIEWPDYAWDRPGSDQFKRD